MATAEQIEQIEEALVQAAVENIASVSVDGLTVSSRSLKEQIAALDHFREETAAPTNSRGLRFTRLIPPGTG